MSDRTPAAHLTQGNRSRSATIALFLLSVCAEQKRDHATAEIGHLQSIRGHTSGHKPWSNQRATGREKGSTRLRNADFLDRTPGAMHSGRNSQRFFRQNYFVSSADLPVFAAVYHGKERKSEKDQVKPGCQGQWVRGTSHSICWRRKVTTLQLTSCVSVSVIQASVDKNQKGSAENKGWWMVHIDKPHRTQPIDRSQQQRNWEKYTQRLMRSFGRMTSVRVFEGYPG